MIKRIARIWPLWLIMLAAYFALLRFDLSFFSDQSKFTWLLRSIALLPGGHVEGDAAPVYGFPILSVGWTLTYEMYFYLLFGACMLFGRWRWIAMTGWLFLTVIAVPYSTGQLDMLLLPAAGPVYASHVASLITNPLILMFAAGALIAGIYQSGFTINNSTCLWAAMFLAASFAVYQYAARFRIDHGIFQWGLSLIPLMLVIALASKRMAIPAPHWLISLGDISFSLYLVHGFVQESFDYIAGFFVTDVTGWTAIILTTSISIVAAVLCYQYLERGLCDALKRRLLSLWAGPWPNGGSTITALR